MTDRDQYLVTTEWLAANLAEPTLRVFDCTVYLRPRDDGKPGYAVVSGREDWAASHIPGSGFADLPGDLSDPASPLRFMMPPAEQFAAAMGEYGLGDDADVVLYDRAGNMWAARIWWMLRAFGFEKARLLDGGWAKWAAESRPVSAEPVAYPSASFTARPRPELIASKEDVLAAIGSGQTCIVNALNGAQHRGEVAPYGRAGHIKGSVNVPAMGAAGVVDPDTQCYLPVADIRARFEAAGVRPGQRLITYCGGGIAASSAAFAATMAGFDQVALYDASLSEWAADPTLPMETGS
ncbi:MAG TPA: sulfurtransferase [Tepidiformaceae bacterium]|nr:sulfurtransferase [Tepidiformaceae bacterium]